MASRSALRQQHQRSHIAKEAARLMVEGGAPDYRSAKRKAAARLGFEDWRGLPRNDEVEAAVHEYQRLFRSQVQPRQLRELRRLAVEAMGFLHCFEPRLVGAVLAGTADEHSVVCLHVFADAAEDVALFLVEAGIDHRVGERRVHLSPDAPARLPTLEFLAGEAPIELVVFSGRYRHRAPLSPVNGKPIERASLAKVEALALDASASQGER